MRALAVNDPSSGNGGRPYNISAVRACETYAEASTLTFCHCLIVLSASSKPEEREGYKSAPH